MNGDFFNRRHVDVDHYQCGCHWELVKGFGDVLRECPIHRQAGEAELRRFERCWRVARSQQTGASK